MKLRNIVPWLTASLLIGSAQAADINKADNADALELDSAWSGGVAPTNLDTAYFDASVVTTELNRTMTLGADVNWGAIRSDGGSGAFILNSANLITLSGNGASRNDAILLNSSSGPSLTIAANLALGTNNTYFTSSRTLTINGNIDLGANTLKLFPAGESSVIEFNGIVTGSVASSTNAFFADQNSGSGTVRFTNSSNSMTGNFELGGNAGRTKLEFTSAGALGSLNQIRFRNTGGTAGLGSLLRYIGSTDETITKQIQCDTGVGMRIESDSVGGSLTLNGTWSINSSRPLYLGGTSTGLNTLQQAFSGSSLTKYGTGTWLLSGTNTYTGATSVNEGTLLVTGSLANTAVTVADGANFGGSGAVAGAVTVDGNYAPGEQTFGTQALNGGVTFGSTGQLEIELKSNAIGVAGTDYDQVSTTTATFDALTAVNVVANASGSTIDYSNAFWNSSQSWTILTTSGGITGTPVIGTVSLDSLGAGRSQGGFTLSVSGNDLLLNWDPTLTPVVGLDITVNGSVMTWTAEQEIGVAEYQVQQLVDGVWTTVEVLTAGSGRYESLINPAYDVRLLVVDGSGFVQSFLPDLAGQARQIYALNAGWNLLSLPLTDADLTDLLDAVDGQPMIWNGSAYEIAEALNAGDAFFVYASEAAEVTVSGTRTVEPLVLTAGWNLAGVTENQQAPIEASIIYTLDTSYDEVTADDLLIEGVGYWIYAD